MVDQDILPGVFALWDGPGEQAGLVERFSNPGTSLRSTASIGASTFRLDLPADSQAAARYLDQLTAQLQDATALLDSALARLDDLILRLQNQMANLDEAWASALLEPEAEVVFLLAEINRRSRPGTDAGLGLRLGGTPGGSLNQALSQFPGEAGRLFQFVGNNTWVETRLQGVLISRTVLYSGGTADILLAQSGPSGLLELHHRSLALAVASRRFFLRLFCVVLQGAGKLSSLLMPSPAAATLALPVTWRFAIRLCSPVNGHFDPTTLPSGTLPD